MLLLGPIHGPWGTSARPRAGRATQITLGTGPARIRQAEPNQRLLSDLRTAKISQKSQTLSAHKQDDLSKTLHQCTVKLHCGIYACTNRMFTLHVQFARTSYCISEPAVSDEMG